MEEEQIVSLLALSANVRRTCEFMASISPCPGNIWEYEARKLKAAEDNLRNLISLN